MAITYENMRQLKRLLRAQWVDQKAQADDTLDALEKLPEDREEFNQMGDRFQQEVFEDVRSHLKVKP